MHRPYSTVGLDTIVSGARLMATAQDLDPEKLESIIRKALKMAKAALLQDVEQARANDDGIGGIE